MPRVKIVAAKFYTALNYFDRGGFFFLLFLLLRLPSPPRSANAATFASPFSAYYTDKSARNMPKGVCRRPRTFALTTLLCVHRVCLHKAPSCKKHRLQGERRSFLSDFFFFFLSALLKIRGGLAECSETRCEIIIFARHLSSTSFIVT